jgi:hypothetical protein
VDAEDGYDGLLFEMDGNLVWNKTAAGRWNTWQIHLEWWLVNVSNGNYPNIVLFQVSG